MEIKGWMKKGYYDVQIKRAEWIREGIIRWKFKDGCNRVAIWCANYEGGWII